jgi:ferredoxin-NADP reductase
MVVSKPGKQLLWRCLMGRRMSNHSATASRLESLRGDLTAGLITEELPSDEFEYYVCGSGRWFSEIQSGLKDRGISPDHIHSEAFGPAKLEM